MNIQRLNKSATPNQPRIVFSPPDSMVLSGKPGQEIRFNGIIAKETATGELEINDPDFILQLLEFGFKEGRNHKPEDLARILQCVPPDHRKDFLLGFYSK